MGGSHAQYCPDCREARQKEAARKAIQRQKAGLARKVGDVDLCEKCGVKYIVQSGMQRFCPSCAPNNYRPEKKEHFCRICGAQLSGRSYALCAREECQTIARIEGSRRASREYQRRKSTAEKKKKAKPIHEKNEAQTQKPPHPDPPKRSWVLLSPTGKRYDVQNVGLFCKEHAAEYGENPETLASGLRTLKRKMQGKANRPGQSHKGWRLESWEGGGNQKIDAQALVKYAEEHPDARLQDIADVFDCSIASASAYLRKAGHVRCERYDAVKSACVVCGRLFMPPVKHNPRKTCSQKCQRKLMGKRIKQGQPKWTDDRRQEFGELMRVRAKEDEATRANIEKGWEARKKSPKFAPTETNIFAKDWTLEAPDSRIYSFRNLAYFCRRMSKAYGFVPTALCDAIRKEKSRLRKNPEANKRNYWGWRLIEWGD